MRRVARERLTQRPVGQVPLLQDHGWGGHQLVMGGAVKGGATYGKSPTLAVNGPDDTSTGRWIPTTAVDQYAATIASWFGVDSEGIRTVFPNLGRFATLIFHT